MSESDKPMDYALDVEADFIASILCDPSLIPSVLWLKPNWFSAKYKSYWQAILETYKSCGQCDLATVADTMESAQSSIDYPYGELISLASSAPARANVPEWATIIHRKAQQRALYLAGTELLQAAFQDHPEVTGDRAVRRILSVLDSGNMDTMIKSYGACLEQYLGDIQDGIDHPGKLIRTGFPSIDQVISGFKGGELIYLAARPSTGKSALAQGIGRRIASRFQRVGEGSVLYVTLEMSPSDLVERFVADRADPPIDTAFIRGGFRLANGDIDTDTYSDIFKYVGQEDEETGKHLFFSDWQTNTDTLNLMVMQVPNCRVLIIDQLDLVDEAGKDEYQQLSTISRKLKKLAMRHKIVVMCLCQINRRAEDRTDRRPHMQDLRGTGKLEQDADMVLGIHNPSFCYPPTDVTPGSPAQYYPNYAELLILKNRKGKRGGCIPLFWKPESAQFADWPEDIFSILAPLHDYVVAREKHG